MLYQNLGNAKYNSGTKVELEQLGCLKPDSIITDDFDFDSNPDVAVLCRDSSSVHISFGPWF
jgi:hypothetical protein